MTYRSKYVPYREARRLVAERVALKQGQINPLELAWTEGEIDLEILSGGTWTKRKPGTPLRIVNPPYGYEPGAGEVSYETVQVLRADIDRLWPPVNDTKPAAKSAAGRPPKYKWEEALIEMGRIAHDDGLPETQAAMEKKIQEFYAKRHRHELDDTGLKERVRTFFRAIKSGN